MPKATVTVRTDVTKTPRVLQIAAMMDVPLDAPQTTSWNASLPTETKPWNVGLVVGPSGAGKSTVVRELFGDLDQRYDWPRDKALLDGFPASMSIGEITDLLTGVGLSSTPAWLRPYTSLSTGEAFRAHVARVLAETPEGQIALVDEWTSTVDRQVAKVASHAIAKGVRRRGARLIAVTCHYDVIDWLQPDWIYQPHSGDFAWRSVQPRPRLNLELRAVDRAAWRVFARHHYLSHHLPAGACYGGFVDGECVAFVCVGGVVHQSAKARNIRRVHRMVVLPDWQGLGIGPRCENWLAQHYTEDGYRFRAVIAHPGLVRQKMASPRWRLDRDPSKVHFQVGRNANRGLAAAAQSTRRLMTYAFDYVPLPRGTAADPHWNGEDR